ncbi:uncharacterized protein A1O9_02240 [Exophiala aquamarina CBS 119918]|uniref:6-phosphofructo-2-kinase domain-containing protein n=1 Tax=Exophiala aquamarina CBS 119918 TaxID=1182545 RepID=A0A072PKQ1_9EURO|nr:uncharacterized protein A1O9_02240 [Exophiala aquamarina CBS 119918]KEF60679.1 hypothetical protein A1O9_02240 [Exophiala aquamarina CBS 119918]
MVELPARGKSYIARKLCRYLNWLQYPTKVFNVGEKRRNPVTKANEATGLNSDNLKTRPDNVAHSAAFFDPDDQNAKQIREQIAMEVLDDLLQYLQEDGKVAIFDATNTTTERRAMIVKRVMRVNSGLKILFIESQCFNQTILTSNINLNLSGLDYKAADPLNALIDFKSRIWMYQKRYTPIDEDEQHHDYSYCQVIDVGRKTITHNINNILSCQVSEFLQKYHLYPRQIWLTRHGESEDDINETLGGDSCLSAEGLKFAKSLS